MTKLELTKIYEEGHADLFPFHLFVDQWATMLADKAGENMRSTTTVFSNGGVEGYTNAEEQTRIARKIFGRLMKEDFFETVDAKTRENLGLLTDFIERTEAADISEKSDSELLEIYNDYCDLIIELNSWGTLVTLLEMGHESVITKEVYEYLQRKGKEVGAEEKVAESVGVLCTPTEGTFLRDKRIGEIRAALLAKEMGLGSKEAKSAIVDIYGKFCWVSYGYTGPTTPLEKFEEEVRELSKNRNLRGLLEEAENEGKEVQKRQAEIERFFNFDDYGKRLFKMARSFMFQKEYRKQVLYHSFYAILGLRKEIAKRAGVGLNQLAYALPEDVEALLAGKFDVGELNRRGKLCVYLPYERRVLTGKDAGEFVASLEQGEEVKETASLEGQSAFSAKPVSGVVRVVLNAHDMKKLREGDILVSPATSPAMVPGLKKAKAIVTDQGGLTCHAAIVARELKKPCVIGTKIATKVLKDGDMVEIDSNKGVVRLLN